MILICSEYDDFNTYEVCKWLFYFGKEYRLILKEDVYQFDYLSITNFQNQISFKINDQTIHLNDFNSYWYRRGGIYFDSEIKSVQQVGAYFTNGLLNHLNNELLMLEKYIIYQSENTAKSLGSFYNNQINKLNILQLATKHGLLIPATYVIKTKSQFDALKKVHKNLIVKAIQDGVHINKEYCIGYFTEKIDKCEADFFFPALVQELVNKKFDIRVFYLDNKFYSMAILSQSDKQTQIDFRKYNSVKPNRTIPFKLPLEIESSLQSLLNHCNYNTASIDLALAQNGNYYFFEINPVGQYQQVSEPCNYYLDKKIAELL